MSESLRDQLLKAGLKQRSGAACKPTPRRQKPLKTRDIDLARAYAARHKAETKEKLEQRQTKARRNAERKKQNDALTTLLKDSALNDPQAEIARHFMDGNRITRIYVTELQRRQLAGGHIGIVKLRGRYLLIDANKFGRIRKIKSDALIDLSGETDAAQ